MILYFEIDMNYNEINRFIDNNEYDKALDALNAVIKSHKNEEEAFYLKGKIHQRLLQWDKAIDAYTKAIEINKNSRAVVALEMLYDILGSLNNEIIHT